MEYLNYSFTAVNSVFKYFKSLDFGLLQQSQVYSAWITAPEEGARAFARHVCLHDEITMAELKCKNLNWLICLLFLHAFGLSMRAYLEIDTATGILLIPVYPIYKKHNDTIQSNVFRNLIILDFNIKSFAVKNKFLYTFRDLIHKFKVRTIGTKGM